jgi:hypothetical protein
MHAAEVGPLAKTSWSTRMRAVSHRTNPCAAGFSNIHHLYRNPGVISFPERCALRLSARDESACAGPKAVARVIHAEACKHARCDTALPRPTRSPGGSPAFITAVKAY